MEKVPVAFFAILMLVFVLAISEITSVKGKICEKPSKTWFGNCKDSDKCDKQCIDWEGAQHGACHQREAKYMCFCYFEDCKPSNKPKPPSPGKSTPPGGSQPTPPGGSQPTPPGGTQPAPPPPEGGQPAPPGGGQPSPPEGEQPTPPEGGQPAPPGGGQPAPPDGGQPAPPGGGQPAPPNGGQPAPPPGCAKQDIDKLIAEALAQYKAQHEKVSRR